MANKVLIISAPSGAGKSTLISYLISNFNNLEFSISATSRPLRGSEVDGKDYYFITPEDFKEKVANGEFIEWEEVYNGRCYGTLKAEIERIWAKNNIVIFDVDVVGGTNIKKLFPDNSLSIFINPPSIEHLRARLEHRNTDSCEEIAKRISKAEKELEFIPFFDIVVVNDDLDLAKKDITDIVTKFINE